MFSEGILVALLVASILCGIGSAVTAWAAFKRPTRGRRALEDRKRLEEWQRRGLLVLHDETTAELLSHLGEADPRRLRALVKDIQQMIEDHEFEADAHIELTIQAVYRAEDANDRRRLPQEHFQVSYALNV